MKAKALVKFTAGKFSGTLCAVLLMTAFLVQPVSADDNNKCGLISIPAPVKVEREEISDDGDTEEIYISPISASAEEDYWGQYAGTFYYNLLSSKEKIIWDKYYSAAMAVFSSNAYMKKTAAVNFNSSDKITEDEITKVNQLFYYANPQFYFLNGASTYSCYNNGYVAGVTLGIAEDFQDGTKRSSATEKFKAKLDEWLKQVSEGEYDEDKVKLAHDIVTTNTIYKTDSANNQSAYSLVVGGETVCAGYAATMQLLLNASGIDTIEVTSEVHGWNMVKIHDIWYTIDATWDDMDSEDNPTYYLFYNKSLATFLSNDKDNAHEMNSIYEGLVPEALYDSTTAGWDYSRAYFKQGDYVYFKVNDNEKLTNRMAKAIDALNNALYSNVPQKVDYDHNEYEVQNPGTESEPDEILTGWITEDGKEYWYENGVKQGVKYNDDGSIDLSYRGKEIYDPDSDAWYWLDNVQGGAKAVSKDVYQESAAGVCAGDSKTGTGKWVRYNAAGEMVKGFDSDGENYYYFDEMYGTMAKGYYSVNGVECYFNVDTGVLENVFYFPYNNGWNLSEDGYYYWFEDYQRQGYSIDPQYRGKEIYDPDSDAWYWLDNVQNGAKAVSKDVYQESLADDEGNIGKWVRYDSEGHMIKGWCAGKGADAAEISSPLEAAGRDVYYFDPVYGTMAKGTVSIDGSTYTFDSITGILK
jgi:glucan-binding YG repeat protein